MSTTTTTESADDQNEGGPFKKWVRSTIRDPKKAYTAMFYTAVICFMITTLFPMYWLLMVALSGSSPQNVGLLPEGFDPSLLAEGDLTMGAEPGVFIQVFIEIPFWRYILNSFVLAIVTTIIVLIVGSLAGYVFGRLRFKGKGPLLLLVLIVSFFPPAAFFIPLFRLFTSNVSILGFTPPGLYNTPGAMFLPFSALFMPLAIFILMTFYAQIPEGLEDAARVEGTTRFGALFRVIIPLSAPGVATAGILTFIAVYNEFFFSSLMTDGGPANWAPIVEGLLAYQGQYEANYELMAAASIVGVLPVAILVVVAQEKIVSGLTAGALKE